MILSRIIIILILIITGNYMPVENQINDYFQYTESIVIYNESKESTYLQNDEIFDNILNSLIDLCSDSREMPAFGVSLHNETLEAMKIGLWIELNFNQEFKHNDMPFTKLLINVNPNFTGFNIIRYHNNKYDGRCFYLDLGNDMSSLYEVILK